ncbi:Crinkler (CRN) family protein [Phytophthora palmivora]|uniref:Crinkler (CRN) family protein n=1 Tax=Phytophthora palmivora TaxID=4796 RepID=A0A2P4XNL4_9STRA|nr:Crinkler (CRN) family protein [Phytophthora palmivora]
MLEEGGMILPDLMKLNAMHVTSVIVPYLKGFGPQLVEKSMPIEASFSWQLLYRFFCITIAKWFELRLPVNGNLPRSTTALEVIDCKLRKKLQDKEEPLYLFLGIDAYQAIEKVRDQQSEKSLVHEVVEIIGHSICTQLPYLILFPMFAGTDWGVIRSGSIATYSYFLTTRLPTTLLTMDEMFFIVGSNTKYARLLEYSDVCRNLFLLGGVSRVDNIYWESRDHA